MLSDCYKFSCPASCLLEQREKDIIVLRGTNKALDQMNISLFKELKSLNEEVSELEDTISGLKQYSEVLEDKAAELQN